MRHLSMLRRKPGSVAFRATATLAWLLVAVPAVAQLPRDLAALRREMVEGEVMAAGITNQRVIESLLATPRHEFIPRAGRPLAYVDIALPIGEGQTISPPFIVAYMTEQLDPQPEDRVLEIGTGSGYQAAVLSPLVSEVYTIEIVGALARRARSTLRRLRYDNVHVREGDGYLGWPEAAPFDKIIVTCSPENVPAPLVEQLREGGRMIVPLGERYQQTFYLLRKQNGELVTEALRPTLFVPMTGRAEAQRERQPDPLRPQLVNGGFESVFGDPPAPTAWHYQRQMTLSDGEDAPEGTQYVVFRNEQPGRGCQALQGLAIDGRRIQEVEISAWVRGTNIQPGQNAGQLPVVGLTFFDENRKTVGETHLGPWRGTFSWMRFTQRLPVAPQAREAIVRIGLLGAVGELAIDDVQLSVTMQSGVGR